VQFQMTLGDNTFAGGPEVHGGEVHGPSRQTQTLISNFLDFFPFQAQAFSMSSVAFEWLLQLPALHLSAPGHMFVVS